MAIKDAGQVICSTQLSAQAPVMLPDQMLAMKYSSEKSPANDASEPTSKCFNAACCNGECNNQVVQQAPTKPTGKQIFCEFCGKVFFGQNAMTIGLKQWLFFDLSWK